MDGSVFARDFLSVGDRGRLRSFVRPIGAVLMTAGPDEVRVPGPNQTNGRCQGKADHSLFAQTRSVSGRAEMAPLGESGGTVGLKICPSGEGALRVEEVEG